MDTTLVNRKQRFINFERMYGESPGVMAIVEDDALEDTILVYFDRDSFKPQSIPREFGLATIDFIDTYEQCGALSGAFEKIKEHYKDDLTVTPVTHFEGMIGFLQIVIGLYELKLNGDTSS